MVTFQVAPLCQRFAASPLLSVRVDMSGCTSPLCLSSRPILKVTTRRDGIGYSFLSLGLRPIRSLRVLVWNTPKSRISNRPCSATTFFIASIMESIITRASLSRIFRCSATRFTISALIIAAELSSRNLVLIAVVQS